MDDLQHFLDPVMSCLVVLDSKRGERGDAYGYAPLEPLLAI